MKVSSLISKTCQSWSRANVASSLFLVKPEKSLPIQAIKTVFFVTLSSLSVALASLLYQLRQPWAAVDSVV